MSKLTYFFKPLSVGFAFVLVITLAILVTSSPSESAAAELVGVEEVINNPDDGAARPPQQQPSGSSIWQDVEETGFQRRGQRDIVPSKFRLVAADINALDNALAQAPMESPSSVPGASSELTLPMPDGTFQRFQIQEYAMMEPGLAAKFPQIKNYLGHGIDDPTATIVLDRTPAGFHGMIISESGTTYIDPYSRGDIVHYMSYNKKDYGNVWGKSFQEEAPLAAIGKSLGSQAISAAVSSGPTLRTYRVAIAATVEYTTFQGGSVAQALAAINTTMNRVNGVYWREVSVRMTLVANETAIIFTSEPDGYTNGTPELMINENQAIIDTKIGSANYDIGHVFGTNSGGLAGPGPCQAGSKAWGVTGSGAPVGDAFDIDYVAHEMGHQFSASHTFNAAATGSCTAGNRSSTAAYEPGSASTILGYAGICGTQDLQNNSDDYFHARSFDQIINYVTTTGSTCSQNTATGNSAPTVEAGNNYTIPSQTPFVLTGSATDVNGNSLTYGWEEFDLGNPPFTEATLPNTDADGNARPIFRSYQPTALTHRNFPTMTNILDGSYQNNGESLPNIDRIMVFRLTARDGLGGVANDTMNVTVSTGSGPFRVTTPTGGPTWTAGSTQTVNWNVAGTNAGAVSCGNVDILMSTDGGKTFTTLLAGTTNDGSENVTIPVQPVTLTKSGPSTITTDSYITYTLVASNPGSQNAIIKVQCSNNIFFDAAGVTVSGSIANSVLITDVVPANTVLIAVNDGGTSTGNTPGSIITWDTGQNLAENTSLAAVTFVVSPTGTTIENTSYVSATNATSSKASNTVNTTVLAGINYLPIIIKN